MNEKPIKSLSDIDNKCQLGQMLLAAIAMLTTESRTDQTPDDVVGYIQDLRAKMYTEE